MLPAGVLALLAVSAVGLATTLDDDPADSNPPDPPVKAAVPYDFDGDGRLELVSSMLNASSPRSSRVGSGVVLIRRGAGWNVITERDAGLPGRPRENDDFGSGLASGDFDRDGAADLVIGAPGRERASVLYGTGRTLAGGRRLQLTGPRGTDQYGYGALARDMDGDGYDDLLVSAPGERGAVQFFRGGSGGLSVERSRPVARPDSVAVGFGSRIRAGDVDGDRHVDLVAGAPTQPSVPGHLTLCRGSDAGPRRCRELSAAGGTSGLAVADVNGDGYADIVQGDSDHAQNTTGMPLNPGQVKLWLGGRDGPRTTPITLTQDTRDIPGNDQPGDEFGAVVEAGDLDADGYADMVVAATRENEGAGRVTVIRGGRRGYASTGNSWFDQDSLRVPGRRTIDGEFGSAISLLNLSDDRRLDLAVAARGEHVANARVMVIEGGPGVFSPDETRTRIVGGAAARVHAPRGVRIRLARVSTG